MTAKLTLTEAPEGSESLELSTASFDKILELLADDKVASLNVPSGMLADGNAEKLADAVQGRLALETFEIGSTIHSKNAVALFSDALLQVPNLREVRFHHTYSRGQGAAEALADLISHHPTLDTVGVKYNGLGLQGTLPVADAIAHNGGLRELDISFNAMGAPGVDALADALATNKGLVKINVDTSYDIEPSTVKVEQMLDMNKNLIAIEGLTSDRIEQRLKENHEAARELAEALAADPESLDKAQREALNERMASATHVLQHEKGLSQDQVMDSLVKVLNSGADHGVDAFPAMMAVLPFDEMLELSERKGHPLTAKDFFDPQTGATPLMKAAIDRGVAARLFSTDMDWDSPQQLMGAYRELPEPQRKQVPNIHQLRAQVSAEANKGAGRFTAMG